MITTRQVPVRCGACGGTGYFRPLDTTPDCPACAGMGWMMVTETTTTPDPQPAPVQGPYVPPNGGGGSWTPQYGWYCPTCRLVGRWKPQLLHHHLLTVPLSRI